jgi:hypothetical protein
MAKADPIHKLLKSLPQQPFWAPQGNVAILEEAVVEAGGDPDAVLAWVEEHGGKHDRTVPKSKRSVFSQLPVGDSVHYYVVPAGVLDD